MTVNSKIQMTEIMIPCRVLSEMMTSPANSPMNRDMATRTTEHTGSKTTADPALSFLRRRMQIQESRKNRAPRASRRRVASSVPLLSRT